MFRWINYSVSGRLNSVTVHIHESDALRVPDFGEEKLSFFFEKADLHQLNDEIFRR